MLVFLEISGLFCLGYRLSYGYVSDGKMQPFSEFSQYYGVITIILASFVRIKEYPFLFDAFWFRVLVPYWFVGVLGGLMGIIYGLKVRSSSG